MSTTIELSSNEGAMGSNTKASGKQHHNEEPATEFMPKPRSFGVSASICGGPARYTATESIGNRS